MHTRGVNSKQQQREHKMTNYEDNGCGSFVSDSDTYERFVGGMTPDDFVAPFSDIDSAVEALMFEFQNTYDHEPADWIQPSIVRYVESKLDD
jgi:hypothetical protein